MALRSKHSYTYNKHVMFCAWTWNCLCSVLYTASYGRSLPQNAVFQSSNYAHCIDKTNSSDTNRKLTAFNRKHTCNFPLASSFGRISYRLRDIDAFIATHTWHPSGGMPFFYSRAFIRIFYLYFDLVQMRSVTLCNKRICICICAINEIYTTLKNILISHNSAADNIFIRLAVVVVGYQMRNPAKFRENSNLQQVKVIQGHRWCQSKAH